MNLHITQLEKRRDFLKKLLSDIDFRLDNSPCGSLRIRNDNGNPRYYHIMDSKDTQGKYINKQNVEMACQLAQKDYMQKLYKEAMEEIDGINTYLTQYGENKLDNVYNSLNEYRKNIVIPMILSDEMYIQQWENEQYEINPYYPEEKVYPTKKDEMVRSKSEVLLADMYCELGIPYRYEARLQLRNGKIKYPDFTILKVKTREIIYHEHLGLMDDEKYRQANLAKLDEYQKNGIYLGKNLILTYEAEGFYLNIKEVKKMVRAIM